MATSFALSSSDNRTFREAIDAVSRAVDEAIIRETPSGLEITAVDAANVLSVDTTVPFAAFDVAASFSGDPFGVDMNALSSALGDINKTSGITLQNVGTEAFTLRDDSTEETVELAMIDPDEMRDPPDLDGSVGQMSYDTTVDVPRNQFRRLIREAGTVSDYVGIGVGPEDGENGPMALKAVAEGDTDTFTGFPEFDFNSAVPPSDPAAGLYTHNYLDSVSLGTPDRGIDVELGFEGDDFPLRVRFDTGGDAPATVTYYIAPRISSESGAAAEEVRSADITGHPVPSPDFVAELGGGEADTFVNTLNTITDERRVVFSREGVESRAVDPANVILDIIEAEPGFFDTYREEAGFPVEPVGVQTQRLAQYYDEWLADQSLTLTFDSGVRFIGLEHPIFSIKMAAIDPDSMRAEPSLPTGVNLDASAEVEQGELRTAIQRVTTTTKQDENKAIGLVVSSNGANAGVYLTNPEGDRAKVGGGSRVEGNALGLYSNDYMRQIAANLIPTSTLPATVRLGNSFPVLVQAPNTGDTFRVTTSLAPRVKDGKQEVLDSDPIADGMEGSGVDLSFFRDDSGGSEVGFFDNVEQESAAERARKQKFQTYPVSVEVSTGYSESSIRIENQDDLSVTDDTIERLKEEVEAFIEDTNIGSRETVGEVTFASDTEYELEFVDVQPDAKRRIIASEGHAFRVVNREENDYLYYSRRDETPARFQIAARAVEDDGTFGVKLGHKVPKETEIRGQEWVIEGEEDILSAYDQLLAFIQDRTITEIVEAAGVDVELSTKESESALNEIRETYTDYTLEVSPNDFDDSFFAALNASNPIAPDAEYRSDISVEQPENPGGDYTVRYTLSYTVKGPTYGTGATISSPEIASRTVGESATREGVAEVVEAALEEIREFGDFFARRDRQDDLPTSGLTSPREGDRNSVSTHTREFLPMGVSRESLKQDANGDIPTELTDVTGIGPARAGEFEDAGVQDVVDVMALLSSVKPVFWLETLVRELPDDPKNNLREAAGDLWGRFVWPQRELPGNLDKDLPDEQVVVSDDTSSEGESLPDGIDSGRWDAYAVALPDGDFRERFEAFILADENRRNPELGIPEESIEKWLEVLNDELQAWMFERGDVVAVASFADDVRAAPRTSASSYDPALDVLSERTTDSEGNLTVTADDGWTGIPPRALREASEGDLQSGWTNAQIIDPSPEGRGYGTIVGWEGYPGGTKYVYNDLIDLPYFVYRLNEETDQLAGLGTSDEPGTRNYVAIYRAPAGDEIIGLDPGTDAGPKPPDPVFRSEFEDEYELFPFFRSQEAVSETIGETVLLRTSSGAIREGEIVGETPDAAGVIISDEVIPDGEFFIPASSEHENSTAEIIGIPRDDDDEAEEAGDEPSDDFGRTIDGTFSDEVVEEGEVEEEVAEPPEPEPPENTRADLPDDSATVAIEIDDLEGTGWVHIERDLSDPAEILLLNDDRTVGLFGRRVKLADQTLIEWTGIQYADPVPEGEVVGSTSPSVDSQELIDSNTDLANLALNTITENPPQAVLDAIGARGGTGEEEVSETLNELASALTDADNLLDAARDAGVMGSQELQRIQRSVQELERRVDALENVPMSSDVEDAKEAIRRFRNREEEAEEVVEEAAEDSDDDEDVLSRGEIVEIIENATAGVGVVPVIIEDDLQRIRLEPDGGPSVVETQVTASRGESRAEMVEQAVRRWDDTADLSAVDVDELNRIRGTINETTTVDLPMLETVPEPDTDETEPEGDGDALPESIRETVVSAFEGMGLPASIPAEFTESSGVIAASPDVDEEWDSLLADVPPFIRQDQSQSDGEFIEEYIGVLADSMTEPARDRLNIDAVREQLGVSPTVPEPESEESGVEGEVEETIDFRPNIPEPFGEMLSLALQQNIPSDERETRMAEILEDSGLFSEEVPGKFTDAVIGLNFPRGGAGGGRQFAENVTVEIGGALGDEPKANMAVPAFMVILSVERPLINIDDAWDDFTDLVQITDPDMSGFDALSEKLSTVIGTTEFQLENDRVDWSELFVEPDEIGQVASLSGQYWANVLSDMKQTSKAWWAAQRVQEVAKSDNQQIRQLLEDEIGPDPARGADSWYLKNAWEIYLDFGDFDPVQFTQDWHDVFRAGESRSKAQRRRGDVDLDDLRERAGTAPGDVPELGDETTETPDPTPERTQPPDTSDPGEKSVEDLKDDIRDRM